MCIRDSMIGDEFLPTERTTPESYELQKLLREMADSCLLYTSLSLSTPISPSDPRNKVTAGACLLHAPAFAGW